MEFKSWLEEADMPERLEDGSWVDLETGIPFSACGGGRSSISEKAIQSRGVAKFFGGKALVGTKAQKEWAEKIRAEKLGAMSVDGAVACCSPKGLLTHSKFWIDNRNASARDIESFTFERISIKSKYDVARAALDESLVAELAHKYNALTAQWGFN